MVIYVNLDEDNYVIEWGSSGSGERVELDKNHEFFKSGMHAWRYVNGELIYDEERNEQLNKEEQDRPSPEDICTIAILELAEQIELLKGDK